MVPFLVSEAADIDVVVTAPQKGWTGPPCAGLVMLDRLDEALQACDRALELDDEHWRGYSNRALVYLKQRRYAEAERDISRGQALSANARPLKELRAMYLDAVDPVSPTIIIEDRREAAADEASR